MELHAFQERLSSLKAALRTWLDHLNRVRRLADEYTTLSDQLTAVVENARNHLDTPFPVGGTAEAVEDDLQISKVEIIFVIDINMIKNMCSHCFINLEALFYDNYQEKYMFNQHHNFRSTIAAW